MKHFDWNAEKNTALKAARGISFEEITLAVQEGFLLDVVEHYNSKKYKNQFLLIVNINNYVYVVPCVEGNEKIFLKTIYPSRKFTKKYLEERYDPNQ